MKTTTIKITGQEERVLLLALRTFQHLHIGNLQRAMEPLIEAMSLNDDNPFSVTDEALRGISRQLQAMITGYADGGPSITNKAVSNDARIARRIETQVTGEKLNLYTEDGSLKT